MTSRWQTRLSSSPCTSTGSVLLFPIAAHKDTQPPPSHCLPDLRSRGDYFEREHHPFHVRLCHHFYVLSLMTSRWQTRLSSSPCTSTASELLFPRAVHKDTQPPPSHCLPDLRSRGDYFEREHHPFHVRLCHHFYILSLMTSRWQTGLSSSPCTSIGSELFPIAAHKDTRPLLHTGSPAYPPEEIISTRTTRLVTDHFISAFSHRWLPAGIFDLAWRPCT
ncbi:uncharacterized protein [Dermacentor andersoni]|uniref:uncharacterized protein n=1 Tax=Dermacentor andersoni TaxID=34620 RepID=UPI00215531DF